MKIQQLLFKLLRKQNVTDGRTHARTDRRTDGQRENSIPHHKQSLGGGGGGGGGGYNNYGFEKPYNAQAQYYNALHLCNAQLKTKKSEFIYKHIYM